MIKPLLDGATKDLADLLPKVAARAPQLQRLADAMWSCWQAGGKVLTAGNGGSAS
jgi:phosphoheptose isomerase